MKKPAARIHQRLAVCGGLCLALCGGATLAADGPAAPKAENLPGGNKESGQKVPAPLGASGEAPYLGFNFSYYGPTNGSRFLAARLVVRNSSSEPMVLKAKDISLRVEGSELRMKDLTTALRNQTIQAGLKTVELSKLKVLADLKVPPRERDKVARFHGYPGRRADPQDGAAFAARRQAARGRRERRGAPGHETAGRTHRAAGMPRPVDDFRRAQHGERGEPLQRLGIAGGAEGCPCRDPVQRVGHAVGGFSPQLAPPRG